MVIAFIIMYMLIVLIAPEEVGVSENTLGNIINADTLEVEVEVQLGFLDEDTTKEEDVVLAALEETGREYIKEEEERIEELRLQEELELRRRQEQNRYKVFEPTGYTEEEFNKMLEGTGLAGFGSSIIMLEEEYGINGVYALGVAMHESANGYSNLAVNQNNFYGMRVSGRWLTFSSKEASIESFGKLMNKSWYKGKSISDIGDVYCPTETGHWVDTVITHMNRLINKL